MIPQKPIGKAKVILQLLLGFKILYDDTDTYNNRREHPVRAASYYCSENPQENTREETTQQQEAPETEQQTNAE